MTHNEYLRAYALVQILMNPDCKYTDESTSRMDKFASLYNRRSYNKRQSYVDVNPEFIKCFKSPLDCIAIITVIIIALAPGVIFVITGWGTFLFMFLLFTFVVSLSTISHKINCMGDLWRK